MPVRKTRSHKVWIMADGIDYNFFSARKDPSGYMEHKDPDWSLCLLEFRRVFGGLGLKPHMSAKRYKITIEEIG